ncbi:MAG: hypothetical protein IPK19_01215 [Chloroflexi bacterium]|nr:hypothetical protein [Chloroflexota bacterium]
MSLLDTLFSHNIMIFSLLAVALILVIAVMAMVAPGIIADHKRSAERKKARKAAEKVMKEAERARQGEVMRRKKVLAERAAAKQASAEIRATKERKALAAGKKAGKGLSPALQAALLADDDDPAVEEDAVVDDEPVEIAAPTAAPPAHSAHPTLSVAALAVNNPGDQPFEFTGTVDLTSLIAGNGPLPTPMAPKPTAPAPTAAPPAEPPPASATSSESASADESATKPASADESADGETESEGDEDDAPGPLDEGYKPMLAEPPGAGKLNLQDVMESVFTEPEGSGRYEVLMNGVEAPSMSELAVLAEQVSTQLRGASPDRRNGKQKEAGY